MTADSPEFMTPMSQKLYANDQTKRFTQELNRSHSRDSTPTLKIHYVDKIVALPYAHFRKIELKKGVITLEIGDQIITVVGQYLQPVLDAISQFELRDLAVSSKADLAKGEGISFIESIIITTNEKV